MKNKTLGVAAGASILALGAIAGISLGNNASQALATDHEHTDACTIHHYAQVNPTSTTYGVKEYWVCCTNHETMFSAPSVGKITTETHDAKFAIDSDDDRYIAPYVIPFDFSSSDITLNSTTTKAISSVGGYDGKVYMVKLTETFTENETYVFIGSYGFKLRGSGVRVAERTSSGYKEADPRTYMTTVNKGELSNDELKAGSIIGLSATIKDEATVRLDIYKNYTLIGYHDFTRATSEISSEDAKFEVGIGSITSCVISSPEA